MAQTAPLITRVLASSVMVAHRAGKIIRDIMSKGDLGIIDKGKDDIQTEADRSAQRFIIASLLHQFPDLTIIGEEESISSEVPSEWIVTDSDQAVLQITCPLEYAKTVSSDIVVWVDPLDGTSEYTQGFLEHVTVLIGISVKGKAVGGVIHQPYYNYKTKPATVGRTMWGLVGYGVAGFQPQTPLAGKFVVTVTRAHSDAVVQAALESLQPDEILRVGGAGNKVLLLMEGKANVYVFASKGCKKWDTCAPEALLKAMGGSLTDIHGNDYTYNKDVEYPNSQGILATAKGVDHRDILNKIPKSVKDLFP